MSVLPPAESGRDFNYINYTDIIFLKAYFLNMVFMGVMAV